MKCSPALIICWIRSVPLSRNLSGFLSSGKPSSAAPPLWSGRPCWCLALFFLQTPCILLFLVTGTCPGHIHFRLEMPRSWCAQCSSQPVNNGNSINIPLPCLRTTLVYVPHHPQGSPSGLNPSCWQYNLLENIPWIGCFFSSCLTFSHTLHASWDYLPNKRLAPDSDLRICFWDPKLRQCPCLCCLTEL